MEQVERISPEEARQKLIKQEALLVCAYDSEDKFRRVHLEGAISLSDFNARLSGLSRETEVIFYCA